MNRFNAVVPVDEYLGRFLLDIINILLFCVGPHRCPSFYSGQQRVFLPE